MIGQAISLTVMKIGTMVRMKTAKYPNVLEKPLLTLEKQLGLI